MTSTPDHNTPLFTSLGTWSTGLPAQTNTAMPCARRFGGSEHSPRVILWAVQPVQPLCNLPSDDEVPPSTCDQHKHTVINAQLAQLPGRPDQQGTFSFRQAPAKVWSPSLGDFPELCCVYRLCT